jgi:hypothetical protein
MNTRTIAPRTIWAILVMEAGLALPPISLPTQGDRIEGLLGPVLLLAMLPLGYLAVSELPALRDPSWRLLVGIGLALATRGIVSSVPQPGLPGLAIWLGRSVAPAAIGVALWWRGGGLVVAELTAAEVRTEFSILAVCMLVVIALMRPFVLPDPALLGGSVGLFALGGLVAVALARQDAAEVATARAGRTLAISTAIFPALAAVFLVSILRPELVGAIWLTLARIVELLLTPIGLLIAWLASLFPAGPAFVPQPLPRPTLEPRPDPAALAQLQDRTAWIGWVVAITLLLAGGLVAIVVVRMMLSNWITAPIRLGAGERPELTAERSGTPGSDAHAFLGWLLRWLRQRFGSSPGPTRGVNASADPSAANAWEAYRGLLQWAERQGLARRPAETTGQLQARLAKHAPASADAVDLVTSTYERERYGDVHPPGDLLRRVRAALRAIVDR